MPQICLKSQVLAVYLYGLLLSAPTGQRSIILPDNSDETLLSIKTSIFISSPRLSNPSSFTLLISSPNLTQREQCIHLVISVEIKGLISLSITTRLNCIYLEWSSPCSNDISCNSHSPA